MAEHGRRQHPLHWYTLALAALAAFFGCPATIRALPITFDTALPVAQDEFVFRPQAAPSYGSGLAGDLIKVAFPTIFVYGPTSRVTLFLTVDQSLAYFDQHAPTGTETRSWSGFDDTLFFVRYTLLAAQTVDSLFRIAPFLGAYLPTGSYQKGDQYGRLPRLLHACDVRSYRGAAVLFVVGLAACASSSLSGKRNLAAPGVPCGNPTHAPLSAKPTTEAPTRLVTRVRIQVFGVVRPYLVYNVIVGLNQHVGEVVAYRFDQRTLILVVDFKPGAHPTPELVAKIVRSAGFTTGEAKVETIPITAGMEEGPGWFKLPSSLSSGPAGWVELNFY
jgi:hypothetical protein